jgi:hypothetical protein
MIEPACRQPIASEGPGNLGSAPADFAVTLNIAQPNAPFFDINGVVRENIMTSHIFIDELASLVVPVPLPAGAPAAAQRCGQGKLRCSESLVWIGG